MFVSTLATLPGLTPVSASAQTLIQCPDWRSLVAPAVLRSASEQVAPGQFDAKLRKARASEARPDKRNVSPPHHAMVANGDDGRRQSTAAAVCTHVIRSGDTYGAISARYLGTSKRWPEIARANPGVDANRLRVGTSVNLPCTQTAGQGGAPTAKPGAPLAGTGFLARLSGQKLPTPGPETTTGATAGTGEAQKSGTPPKATGAAQSKQETRAKTAKADPTAKKQAAPAKPVPPPLPVWTAKKGEDFAAVLQRWGKVAGYRVTTNTSDVWTISVPVKIQGDFETALKELVRGLGSGGTAPPVRVYSNRVVRLGGL